MSKNKVPRISRSQGRVRIKGVVNYYYSPYWQRWIAKAWPRGQGADTAKRARSRAIFTNVVSLIKNAVSEDFQAAADHSAGTPLLPRDFLMKAATGTLIQFTDTNGRQWMSTRNAIQFIQPSLDSISNTPGSILVRGSDFWDFLAPPTENSQLQFDLSTMSPTWQPLPGEPAFNGFLASYAGATSIVADSTYRKLTGITSVYDSQDAYDATTGLWKPNIAGKYLIFASGYAGGSQNATFWEIMLSKNGLYPSPGSALAFNAWLAEGSGLVNTPATICIAVAEFDGITDTMEFDYYCKISSGTDYNAGTPTFGAIYLGT